MRLTSDASVVDADLAQKSSLDIIKLGADAGDDAQSVTLAANAMAAGFATVDASQAGASDTVTVDARAYTQDLTVILHGGADIVTLGSGNDTLLGGVSAGDIINLGAGDDSFAITTLAAVTIDGGIDLDTLGDRRGRRLTADRFLQRGRSVERLRHLSQLREPGGGECQWHLVGAGGPCHHQHRHRQQD